MKRSKWSVILSLLLVFSSGIAVGIFGRGYYDAAERARTYRPRTPEEFRKAYLTEMSTRLSLSQEQQNTLNQILDDTRAKFHALRERQRPETKAIQEEQVERVNAMLTETQRAEYAKMRAEREAKKKADEKGRGPRPTS